MDAVLRRHPGAAGCPGDRADDATDHVAVDLAVDVAIHITVDLAIHVAVAIDVTLAVAVDLAYPKAVKFAQRIEYVQAVHIVIKRTNVIEFVVSASDKFVQQRWGVGESRLLATRLRGSGSAG